MENWVPVTDENGECLLQDNNIVVQNKITGEIGHVPATTENYNALNIIVTNDITSNENAVNSRIEWGDDETRMLLDLYHEYLPQIGPMKKFKNKKKVWERISLDIETKLGILRTSVQCESKFKTIMRRKSLVTSENNKSGNTRMSLPYEAEIAKIKVIDDSIEPEVLMDINHKIINVKSKLPKNPIETCQPSTSKSKDEPVIKKNKRSLADTMLSIHREKEENRERRHKEKMALLEKLCGNHGK